MLKSKDYVAPYNSRGKRISKSSHHPDLWIISIIGTNKGYHVTMSTQLMLQNNPPDKEKKESKHYMIVADFHRNEVAILQAMEFPMLNTGRTQSRKRNQSNSPKGLADIR
jgi:hypothetical protein